MLDFNSNSLDWDSLEKNLGADVKDKPKKNYKDDRLWRLAQDENGAGGAIIRLLPDPEGKPFIRLYKHAFSSYDPIKKRQRWYIGTSPQTIEQPCPASDLWQSLMGIGTEEAKQEARSFNRSIKYMCNIKVIKDPANPQNEGKIFLWEFGTKLKDKFMAALNPSETERQMGEEPKQLFNPFTGCNVKLKIKKVAGFPNYDETEIMGVSAIYENGDVAKEDILANGHKLSEFLKPDAFDSYEELKGKLKYVLETYKPKHLDEVVFRNAVAPLISGTSGTNEEAPKTESVKENVVDSVDVSQTETPANDVQETPKVETKQDTTQSAPSAQSDDLSFLEDL